MGTWQQSGQTQVTQWEKKERQLESISLYLAMDNVPTEVVESKHFRAMLNSFASNAALPSVNKVKDQF
jgi:NADPH-dependent 7-cyano-7-deazaguanine reductase QueF-like protein